MAVTEYSIDKIKYGDNVYKLIDNTSGYTKNVGTITGITMNGASKGTSGVVDLGTVITSHQSISGKADKSATVSTVTWDSTNNKLTKTINGTTTDVVALSTIKTALGSMPASDVYNWAKASSKPSYNFSEIGSKPTTISGYGITDAYTKTEIDGKLSGAFHYKGTKDTVSNLPSTGNVTGDLWHVTANSGEYAWDGTEWQELGSVIDLSGYVPTSRTINSKALTGNISLTASDVGAATSDHTHATSIATSSGTNKITLAFGTKYALTAGGTSYVFTMPSNPNTDHYDWSDITNKPSTFAPSTHTHDYAASNHTHATSIATSTATNQITLTYGTKYAITAGGTSYVFTMPSAQSVPTTAASATTGISIANHSTTSITGVSGSTTVRGVKTGTSSTTTASKASGGNGSASTWTFESKSIPNVTAKGSGSFTQGAFSGGSFTQGADSFTPNTPTVINTSKFSGGSFTRGSFSGGSGSFTQGAFSGGSLTFAIDSTDNNQLNITFTAATHGTDSHTHNAATHAADSFTAASIKSGFYTAGTAASFTQGEDSFTPATHGADSHTHTAPTLGTAITVYSKSGGANGSAPTWSFTDVTVPIVADADTTVPIAASSATTVVTSKGHTVTDNGHTHSLS